MINWIFLIIVLSSWCYGDPQPPKTWPVTWSSWIVVSINDNSLPDNPVIYDVGQMIAYDPTNLYACRYNQQDLLYPSSNRTVDMCDYSSGNHYRMYSFNHGFNCSKMGNLNGTALTDILWPLSFLAAAKYIGSDNVNGVICNHFVAVGIILDGKTSQLDVWTSEEKGYPCQISSFVMGSPLHYNWAFNGFSELIPPEAMQCTAPHIICTEPDWICNIKPGVSDDSLGVQLQWVCQPERLDCTPINPYGPYFKPNTVQNHCNWAFNTYYQANRISQGIAACEFNGTAQLVPPSSIMVDSDPSEQSFHRSGSLISNINIVC